MLTASSAAPQKIKIQFENYPSQIDAEACRLLCSLSEIEVTVVKEILHQSIKIELCHLQEELALSEETLLSILEKLSKIKLFKLEKNALVVDKDKRKRLDIWLEKFQEEFKPNLAFLQQLLTRVPVHAIASWYAIPRTTDHVFEAIFERYFETPKLFRQYVAEIEEQNAFFRLIIQEVFRPPHFKATVESLKEKLDLSEAQLSELLLVLEYHFICCLSYKTINGQRVAMVTPFQEWQEVLEFEFQTRITPLPAQEVFADTCCPLAVVEEIRSVVRKEIEEESVHRPLLEKLYWLGWIKQEESGSWSTSESGREWLAMPLHDQITTLATHPLYRLDKDEEIAPLWNLRNLRLVEKSLRRLPRKEWVDFELFLRGITMPLCDHAPTALKYKGKQSRYFFPVYSKSEKLFITRVILERFVELGIIKAGTYHGKKCILLTALGSRIID